MDNEQRVILEGSEARESIKRAIEKVGNIVSATLGPAGQNVILDRARRDRAPLITNDGVSIADEIRMENECDDLVVQTIVETAKRTNDEAGDGTTTSITIAKQLVVDALEEIGESIPGIPSKSNSMSIARRIEEEKNLVIKELATQADPVDSLEKLKDITFSSLENKEVGDIVAEAVWEVGKDGFATMEVGYNGIVEKDVVQGMKVYAKYAAPFMVTNDKKQAVYLNAPILVTNLTFSTIGVLKNLFTDMGNKKPDEFNSIVIFGSKFEADAIKQAFTLLQKSVEASQSGKGKPFRVMLVKAPSLTDEELEDVAAFLDAKFINGDSKVGMKVENAKYEDLGMCEKIIIGDEETVMIGGRGLKTIVHEVNEGEDIKQMNRVDARVAVIKEQLKLENDEVFKKKMERRLGILGGGISVVKVGAKTDTERSYLQHKVEDAINAAKAALQEGMVKGGGLALKEIADKHPELLIANALRAPYNKIRENAGGEIEIGDNIKDPVKVTRSAFENAVSVAKILITTNTIIAEKRPSMVEDLKEILPIK